MADALLPTLVNIFHDFDEVLLRQVGGLHKVETLPVSGSFDKLVDDGLPVNFRTYVDVRLHTTKPLTIDIPLIGRATNAEEMLRYVVDEHYKPLQDRLAKAVHAAHTQWATMLDG